MKKGMPMPGGPLESPEWLKLESSESAEADEQM